jgi:hypothetical protein
MRSLWRDNGLSITLLVLFLASIAGQAFAGHRSEKVDRRDHGEAPEPLLAYVTGGQFVEAVFENWESEFLQMAVYVMLTAWLFQRGSAESKDPDAKAPQDEDPRDHMEDPDAPGAVRRGGWRLPLYENSLALAFGALFVVSLTLHAAGGAQAYNEERLLHGEPAVGVLDYAGSSRFWFESLQNWQSEFLAVFTIVVLSIVLRQRGSAQSKPVHASHRETGK